MKKSYFAGLGAALGVALLSTQAAAAVTAISGYVNVTASATADGGQTVTDSPGDSWTGVPTNLGTVGANAVSSDGNGNAISAFGYVYGAWNSESSGVFQGQDFGWNFNNASGEADTTGNPVNWSYTFDTSAPASFNLGYNVYHFGNGFGLWGWNLALDGNDILNLQNAFSPDASGNFSYDLTSGTHTVELRNNANLRSGGFTQSYLEGDFSWSIGPPSNSDVPEPASWALMLMGFGGLGAALRRRRAATRLAIG